MRVAGASRSLVFSLIVATALPLAALTSAETASAQDVAAQDIAQARTLGQQAEAAYAKGDFVESEKLWAAAAKLYTRAPTLTLGLARTQAKLGKVVAAQESYNKIIREWGDQASPPPAFKDALDAARAEVGAVSAKVANVTITIVGPASPTVTIDGAPVPAAALGLKRPVDPGSHKVVATADGFAQAETTFSVAEGGSATSTLKMEAAPGAVAPVASGAPAQGAGPSPIEPGADTSSSKGSLNKTLAVVAFGVGGAGLLVGAVTGLIAVGKHGDLNSKCMDGVCTDSLQSDVDSYRAMGAISTIGFVVAGIGGATGLVLLLTAPKGDTASSASARGATVKHAGPSLTPYFGGTSAGFTGRF